MSKSKNNSLNIILNHPDKEEIISKLALDIEPTDINSWLSKKYSSVNDSNFILSVRALKHFKENYLEVYNTIQADILKTKAHLNNNVDAELELSLENIPGYQKVIMEAANNELDIRKIVKRLCVMIEKRLSQVFDEIQEDPRNINTRIDRILIEYTDVLGNVLEKYYKFTESPDSINNTTNNITIQVMDQHIAIFQDTVKEVLQNLDFDTSLQFMELYNQKISQLNMVNEKDMPMKPSEKLAEVKLLNETIDQKLNG